MKNFSFNLSIYISAAFVIMAAISCNTRGDQPQQVTTLKGILQNSTPARVVLYELDVTGIQAVDSVMTGHDGSFVFGTLISEPTFYQLNCGNNDPMTLIALPGETITLAGKADSLVFAVIDGSDESRLLQKYLAKSYNNHNKTSDLGRQLADSRNHPRFLHIRDSIVRCFDSLFNDQQAFVRQFIRQHPSSLASLIAINQKFGNKAIVDEIRDKDLFALLDSGLRKQYPRSRHTLSHHTRLAERARLSAARELAAKALKPGKPAPYFRLRSIQSAEWVTPKEFLGKPCILVFWAPGETNSGREIRTLKNGLNEASWKEIHVLAVAMTRDGGLWETAVKEEGIAHWGHASDLKGLLSPVSQLYNLPASLPFFYYLDDRGHITGSFTTARDLLLAAGAK